MVTVGSGARHPDRLLSWRASVCVVLQIVSEYASITAYMFDVEPYYRSAALNSTLRINTTFICAF